MPEIHADLTYHHCFHLRLTNVQLLLTDHHFYLFQLDKSEV